MQSKIIEKQRKQNLTRPQIMKGVVVIQKPNATPTPIPLLFIGTPV